MVIVDLEDEVVPVTDIVPADIGLAGTDIWDRDTNKALVTGGEGIEDEKMKCEKYFYKMHSYLLCCDVNRQVASSQWSVTLWYYLPR